MKPKNIIIAVLLAIVILILFNNKEESSFWLFGDIRTSKLIILCIFYVLGIITGAVVFRRKNKHPKEYGITNPNYQTPNHLPQEDETEQLQNNYDDGLTDEDREFLRRD